MRTTLTLDDDVLLAACQLASQRGETFGAVISELSRRALTSKGRGGTRNGIKLLPIGPGATGATLDEVNRLRNELP